MSTKQIDLGGWLAASRFSEAYAPFDRENRQQVLQTVPISQAVQTRNLIPFRELQTVDLPRRDTRTRILEAASVAHPDWRDLCQGIINATRSSSRMGKLCLIA